MHHMFWNFRANWFHKPLKQLIGRFLRSQLAYTKWYLGELRHDFFINGRREELLGEGYRSLLLTAVVAHQFNKALYELDTIGYTRSVLKGTKQYGQYLKEWFGGELSSERTEMITTAISSKVISGYRSPPNGDDPPRTEKARIFWMEPLLLLMTVILMVDKCGGYKAFPCTCYICLAAMFHLLIFTQIYLKFVGRALKGPEISSHWVFRP